MMAQSKDKGTPNGEPHADRCPACCDVVAEPWDVEVNSRSQTREHYVCELCGYTWVTTWDEGVA